MKIFKIVETNANFLHVTTLPHQYDRSCIVVDKT